MQNGYVVFHIQPDLLATTAELQGSMPPIALQPLPLVKKLLAQEYASLNGLLPQPSGAYAPRRPLRRAC